MREMPFRACRRTENLQRRRPPASVIAGRRGDRAPQGPPAVPWPQTGELGIDPCAAAGVMAAKPAEPVFKSSYPNKNGCPGWGSSRFVQAE